jgi:hypothetical protein
MSDAASFIVPPLLICLGEQALQALNLSLLCCVRIMLKILHFSLRFCHLFGGKCIQILQIVNEHKLKSEPRPSGRGIRGERAGFSRSFAPFARALFHLPFLLTAVLYILAVLRPCASGAFRTRFSCQVTFSVEDSPLRANSASDCRARPRCGAKCWQHSGNALKSIDSTP